MKIWLGIHKALSQGLNASDPQASQSFPPSPHAGRATQPVFGYSACPPPWLPCSCICLPLFPYITPACGASHASEAGLPSLQLLDIIRACTWSLARVWGTPEPKTLAAEGGQERALGLCSATQLCTVCMSNSFPQNVCNAMIYFAAYD